jgi:hypothetical protein
VPVGTATTGAWWGRRRPSRRASIPATTTTASTSVTASKRGEQAVQTRDAGIVDARGLHAVRRQRRLAFVDNRRVGGARAQHGDGAGPWRGFAPQHRAADRTRAGVRRRRRGDLRVVSPREQDRAGPVGQELGHDVGALLG